MESDGGAWHARKTEEKKHTSQSCICWFVPKDLPTSRAWLRAVCRLFKKFLHGIFADVNVVSPDIGKMIVKSNFITGRLIFPRPPCVCKDFPCYWFFSIQLCWEIAANLQRGNETRRGRGRRRRRKHCQHVASSARAGNYHHQLISGFPGSHCGYFEWTGCKRTCHTHK